MQKPRWWFQDSLRLCINVCLLVMLLFLFLHYGQLLGVSLSCKAESLIWSSGLLRKAEGRGANEWWEGRVYLQYKDSNIGGMQWCFLYRNLQWLLTLGNTFCGKKCLNLSGSVGAAQYMTLEKLHMHIIVIIIMIIVTRSELLDHWRVW